MLLVSGVYIYSIRVVVRRVPTTHHWHLCYTIISKFSPIHAFLYTVSRIYFKSWCRPLTGITWTYFSRWPAITKEEDHTHCGSNIGSKPCSTLHHVLKICITVQSIASYTAFSPLWKNSWLNHRPSFSQMSQLYRQYISPQVLRYSTLTPPVPLLVLLWLQLRHFKGMDRNHTAARRLFLPSILLGTTFCQEVWGGGLMVFSYLTSLLWRPLRKRLKM